MELHLGPSNIFLIDNIFEGSNLLGKLFKPVSAFIIFTAQKTEINESKFTYFDSGGVKNTISFPEGKMFYSDGLVEDSMNRLNNDDLRDKLSKDCLKLTLDLISSEKG
jgi:hypothetical protein